MNILITGGGGFIGSHLVDSQLAQGHQVRSADLYLEQRQHAAAHPDLEMIKGDLQDPALRQQIVTGVDVVYHLASAHLDTSLPAAYYHEVNVTATLELVRAAHTAGVRRFIHCSTNGVIGDLPNPPADETTPCHPTNIYEQTKLAGEQAALAYAQETGFPVVVIRPAWVYGPRCPRTAKLLRTIKKRRFILFGDGQTLRHPIYIEDALAGLEAAAAHGAAGELYFIAGEKPVTIKELLIAAAQVQGVNPPRLRLPLALGLLAGIMLEIAYKPSGKQPPISRRTLDFFRKNNAYDISKARRDLGFNPQVDLHQGLAKTVRETLS